MKIIEPSVELINPVPYEVALNTIELAGRTCYQSEDKITDGSAEALIRRIIKSGHESVLEHVSVTARFICDRPLYLRPRRVPRDRAAPDRSLFPGVHAVLQLLQREVQ